MKQLMRAQEFEKKKKKIRENFNFFLEKRNQSLGSAGEEFREHPCPAVPGRGCET